MQANNSIPYDFINSFDEPVFFLSSNFTIQALNISAEKLFTSKASFVIGQSFSIVCPNFDINTQKLLSSSMTSCIGEKIIIWRSLSCNHPKDSIKFMMIGYREEQSNFLLQNNGTSKKIDVSTYEDIKNLNQTLTGKTLNHDKDTLEHVKDIYHYMENIIAEIPVSVYWMNKECIYLGCSNSMAKLLKLASRHDIIGKTYADLYDEKSSKCYRIADKIVMDTGVSLSAEEPLYSPDGTKNIYLSNKVPLRESSGEIIGMLGISVDITAQKNMEEALKKAKEAAESGEKAKGEFIANVSHDMRTPLSGIINTAHQLEGDVISEEERKNLSMQLADSGDALLEMFQEILEDVAADHMTEKDIVLETFDINLLVDRLVKLQKPSLTAKGLKFLSNIDPNIPQFLVSDHRKIHRIILNLIGNAVKFTKQGHIELKIELLEKQNDSSQLTLKFNVIDTGIGVPEESKKHLFERFYKASPSHKAEYKGFGLGLHIAQSYAQLLGGTIGFESTEGIGSDFYAILTLKIANENEIAIYQEKIAKKPSLLTLNTEMESKPAPEKKLVSSMKTPDTQPICGAPNVLIIEDNVMLRISAARLLKKEKLNVTAVDDGLPALELAKNQQFDLILSDVGLTQMSGNEFTQKLRAFEKENNRPPVPIIGVTAHAADGRGECLSAGMNAVTQKPFLKETLIEILRQFLPNHKLPKA